MKTSRNWTYLPEHSFSRIQNNLFQKLSFLKICIMWEVFLCSLLILSIGFIMPHLGGNQATLKVVFNGPKRKLLQNSTEKISKYSVLFLFGNETIPVGHSWKKSPFSAVVPGTVCITAVMQESLHSGHEFTFWVSASLSAISWITAIYPHNARQLFRREKKYWCLTEEIKLMDYQKPTILALD